MGTRSRIGVMHGEVCKSVYCHWDGYLEHNGRILQEYYDSARANHLVALGDISSLGPVLGQTHPFSNFEITDTDSDREAKLALMELAKTEGWCTFYGRDRGEIGVEFKTDLSFADFLARAEGCGAEYYYIMKDGVWYTGCPGDFASLTPLATVLANDNEPDSETQADLNETLGLDRGAPLEDLVARIEDLDKTWETVDL